MNTTRFLIALCLSCLVLPVLAETAYTPKPGTAERKEICDGLRSFIISEYSEKKLPKPIVLKVDYLKVSGDYCWIEALPMFEDGSDAVPQFLPDIGYSHCLKRINVGWHVILDLSRTDVPDGDEVRKIRKSFPGDFPVSILPKFWQDLFQQYK
jgi:hypothetical protein